MVITMKTNNLKNIIISILTIIIVIVLILLSKRVLFKDNSNLNNTYNDNLNNYSKTSDLELTEAKVTKIIDGDTIWVDINGKEFKIRLIGINCPEYTTKIEPYGKEATEFTTKYLTNKTVYLQTDISDKDKYDRLLRYVWLEKIDEINEENIKNYLFNAIIVKEGLAKSNYYKPNITLQTYLEELEKEAKSNKIGMWK